MNNLPDQDPQLTNFLRQHRSIAPAELPGLEDRLMLEINALAPPKQQRSSNSWQRYLIAGIGLMIAGIFGTTMFQIFNPPESSIAELDQLNLFLEAHVANLTDHAELDPANHEDLVDLDPDLL
jgi:hypothetical protein